MKLQTLKSIFSNFSFGRDVKFITILLQYSVNSFPIYMANHFLS